MARARAGVAEANIALGGPVSAKINAWVFVCFEEITIYKILRFFFRLNAQASAQAADGSIGAQADASVVKVE